MDPYQSEEEQIAQLKKWWQEKGQSVLTAVAVVAILYFGYSGWSNHVASQKMAASEQYHQLLEVLAQNSGLQPASSETSVATAKHLAGELKTNYARSVYAHYAAMLLAKQYVEAEQLPEAAAELEWVLAQEPDAEVAELATVRLARVKLAQDEVDAALKLVSDVEAETYVALFEAVKGDAYLIKGDQQKAGQHFQKAVELQRQAGVQVDRVLQMKADALVAAKPEVLVKQQGAVDTTVESAGENASAEG